MSDLKSQVLAAGAPYTSLHNRSCAIVEYSVCSCDIKKLTTLLEALASVANAADNLQVNSGDDAWLTLFEGLDELREVLG